MPRPFFVEHLANLGVRLPEPQREQFWALDADEIFPSSLCCVVLCGVLSGVVWCCVVLCCVVLCGVVWCCVVLCGVVWCCVCVLCCVCVCCVVLCGVVWCCVVCCVGVGVWVWVLCVCCVVLLLGCCCVVVVLCVVVWCCVVCGVCVVLCCVVLVCGVWVCGCCVVWCGVVCIFVSFFNFSQFSSFSFLLFSLSFFSLLPSLLSSLALFLLSSLLATAANFEAFECDLVQGRCTAVGSLPPSLPSLLPLSSSKKRRKLFITGIFPARGLFYITVFLFQKNRRQVKLQSLQFGTISKTIELQRVKTVIILGKMVPRRKTLQHARSLHLWLAAA